MVVGVQLDQYEVQRLAIDGFNALFHRFHEWIEYVFNDPAWCPAFDRTPFDSGRNGRLDARRLARRGGGFQFEPSPRRPDR